MRAILQSETYQRSSNVLPENKADTRFYARYYPRRLMAEVALDAVSQVTRVPTPFETDVRNQNQSKGTEYPKGWRAVQLPDANLNSYFLKSFGRPNRLITCECERTGEPSMAQALHISNGDTLNQKLEAKDNAIGKALAAKILKLYLKGAEPAVIAMQLDIDIMRVFFLHGNKKSRTFVA